MERKIGIAILSAAIAYAVLRFGAGTVAFKPGLDVEQLKANANIYGLIGAAIVGGLVLAFSSTTSQRPSGAERKVGIAILSAAIAYAVLRFGAGTVAFKPGLDVEQLKANANIYGLIGAAIVGGLVLAFSSTTNQDRVGTASGSQAAGLSLRELAEMKEARPITREAFQAKQKEAPKGM